MDEQEKPVLTQLLSVSRRLAEAASDGDWEGVDALKSRQTWLVKTLFDGQENGPLSGHVLSELTQVRVFTDLVVELARQRRETLLDKGDAVRAGRKAAHAYAQEERAGY
jgi:hypothetical protein